MIIAYPSPVLELVLGDWQKNELQTLVMLNQFRNRLLIWVTVPTIRTVCSQVDKEVVENKFIDIFLLLLFNFWWFNVNRQFEPCWRQRKLWRHWCYKCFSALVPFTPCKQPEQHQEATLPSKPPWSSSKKHHPIPHDKINETIGVNDSVPSLWRREEE